MIKKDIWMPLNVGDYLADTGHLSTTQHGAYLLLIMHYWRKRCLPDDDKQLAAIAKLPLRIWLDTKETIQSFFHDGWQHKRVDAELARRAEVSEKRAASGSKGGSKNKANASDCLSKTQLQDKDDRIGSAGASAFTEKSKALADAFLQTLGFDTPLKIPPEFAGVDWRAIGWEAAGWTADLIATEARKNGPEKPLTYHEKCFATAFAKRQAPLPIVEIKQAESITVTHGRTQKTESLSHVARRHAENGITFGERPATPSVCVIPSGPDVRLLSESGRERPGDLRGSDGIGIERISAGRG